jgi:hypothetical protein
MSSHPQPSRARPSFWLRFVRWYFPIAVIVGGIVAFLVDPSVTAAEGAAGVIGAGLAWILFGWLYRKGEEGDNERDVEDAARRYFDEHGEWPTDAQYETFERYGRWSATP